MSRNSWRHSHLLGRAQAVHHSGASFQLFLGGAKFFLNFSMPPDYWKKQHFTCSNLTLFVVLFFLFSLFLIFFLFSFFFFFFSFSLGGATAPQPPSNDAPDIISFLISVFLDLEYGKIDTKIDLVSFVNQTARSRKSWRQSPARSRTSGTSFSSSYSSSSTQNMAKSTSRSSL